MLLLKNKRRIKLAFSILSSTFLLLFMSACSTNSGGGVSLDGDLRYMVEGSEGESLFLSYGSYTSNGGTFETIGSVTIGSSGSVEGDLEDGDFTGYQLQGSPQGSDNPDITLKLMSDGEVLGETSEVNSNGIFMVEVGEIPSFEDFE